MTHSIRIPSLFRALPLGLVLVSGCGDGIETNLNPEFEAGRTSALPPEALVIGLVLGDEVRAYPLQYLAPIEILNDKVGARPIAITWCPLSASGVVFSREVNGDVLTFKFHPDLYKRNLIVEDLETHSQWNQLERGGIKGRMRDSHLQQLPSLQTTWGVWRELHPDSKVMLPGWGEHSFSYRPMGNPKSDGLADRSLVHVVFGPGETKVFPLQELEMLDDFLVETVGGSSVRVHFRAEGPTAFAESLEGELLPGITLYNQYVEELYPEAKYWRR
jgi:hypothetical protein